MRWINKLSNTDIEKFVKEFVKKIGVEYESLRIEKDIYRLVVYLDNNDTSLFIMTDFQFFRKYNHVILTKNMFYLFMENKFGREYLIDLIRNKTGLSGKFLRKKLRKKGDG